MSYKIDVDFLKSYDKNLNVRKDNGTQNVESLDRSKPNRIILTLLCIIFLLSLVFPIKSLYLTRKLYKLNRQYSSLVDEEKLSFLNAKHLENQELSTLLKNWDQDFLPQKGVSNFYEDLVYLASKHKGHLKEFTYNSESGVSSVLFFMTSVEIEDLISDLKQTTLYISEITHLPNHIEILVEGGKDDG